MGLNLQSADDDLGEPKNYAPLTNVRQAPGGSAWNVRWQLSDTATFSVYAPGMPSETAASSPR